jgi:hypothetical protein
LDAIASRGGSEVPSIVAASSQARGQQKWWPVLRSAIKCAQIAEAYLRCNQALRRLRKLICGPRSRFMVGA